MATASSGGAPRATAIIRKIPAITSEQIARQMGDLWLADEKAKIHYADTRNHVRALNPEITDEWIMLMETKGWIGNSALYPIHGAWLVARRAAQNLKLIEEKLPKVVPARAHIAVVNSFSLKDELKARSYRFDRDGHWRDVLGQSTMPAWCKTISVGALDLEVQILTTLGVVIQHKN